PAVPNPNCHPMSLSRLALLTAALFCCAPAAAPAADELVAKVIPHAMARAVSQYEILYAGNDDPARVPRSTGKDGKVVTVRFEDWTSGFFPGCLWFLHEYTGEKSWKTRAREVTNRLERIRHFRGNHDGGFMLGCSFGNALRLDPTDGDRAVLRDAANALASRYIPAIGMIRSWDHGPYTCPVIIDNMMNLELLSWAAKNGGESRLREIALSHADHTHANHFRPDGSAYHVVDYNPENGWVRAIHATQGADVRTPWARGQGWTLYGFTMMHRETGKPEYLERATRLAGFLLSHPNLPADHVPSWDYGAEPGPDTPRDASAAAIIASALIELASIVPEDAAAGYLDHARSILRTLASPAFLAEPGTHAGFLLTRSTGHLPGNSEISVPLIYADYYFLEAMLRYRDHASGRKRVHFGQAR
ncbi:MAG: glycoside hydrolase family 88 protein, partial [Akkermansiaceae bacterium]|nr:glycoside hydrolase family 88 protein [Akkermansiaceae bacterium]